MRQSKRIATRIAGAALAGSLLAAPGCVSRDRVHAEFDWERTAEQNASETPLGGPALVHRKQELQRAKRDLDHFYNTMKTLRDRKDRSGYLMLASFMDAYFGLHVERLGFDDMDRYPRNIVMRFLYPLRRPRKARP